MPILAATTVSAQPAAKPDAYRLQAGGLRRHRRDGRRMLFVYDHGEGDEVALVGDAFLRMEDGKPPTRVC